MSKITQEIEELSIAVVMADTGDLQGLGELYKRFDKLSNLALNESLDLVARAAQAAGELIENIIMYQVPDRDAAVDVIAQTVSVIQAIVVNQRKPAEVPFPQQLGLQGTDEADMEKEIAAAPPDAPRQGGSETEPTAATSGEGQEETEAPETPDEEEGRALIDPELAADFVSEAREHLHDTDVQLLTLESDPGNDDALNAVYRAFHTIKGVAVFLDLGQVSELSHATENLLDHARKGDICLTGPAIDVTFESADALKQMIDDVEAGLSSGKVVSRSDLLLKLLPLIEQAISGGEAQGAKDTGADTVEVAESPTQAESVPEETESMPEGVFSEVPEAEETVIQEKIDEELQMESAEQEIEGEEQRAERKVQEEKTEEAVAKPAPAVQQQRPAKSSSAAARVKETLKIDTERLDKLVNTIGELVIAESMVSQDAEILENASPRVSRNLSHLSKITRELQELGMSLRLMPVRPIFERMARLVRDLSKKADKKIEFTMSGEDTEVDKSIVEKISDPLTHMLRNSVDHGIEAPDEDRVKAGKPEVGHIELRAFHKGSNIHIEVEDDGRGLDREVILAKARERDMITNGDSMSDKEVFNLIFAPGFSTAKEITNISGRGVGMDVVNRNLQALRGKMEIESTLDKGSVFSMRLPLTLAIIDGIVVRVGTERYIIPTLSVLESLRPAASDIPTVLNQGEMISIREQLLPLFRVSRLFNIGDAAEDPTQALVIVVKDGEKQTGLLVDDLIGHQQVVIKNLGGSLGNVTGISGGAIMPDGRVGLILDVAGIISLTTGAGDVLAV